MKFSTYIWAIYLIVFPFYLFEPGNPQLADLFGVILIFSRGRAVLLNVGTSRFTRGLFIFVMYTFIVNAVWMLIVGELKILKNSLFYLYSFFIMLSLVDKIKDEKFLLFTFRIITVSLIIQTVLWPFVNSQSVRNQMFFNNPNQLGLWALCLLVISSVIIQLNKIKLSHALIPLILSTFFIIISASRAALLGSIIFWLFYIIKSKKHLFIFAMATVVIVFLISYNYELNLKNFTALEYNIQRAQTESIVDNRSLGGRGYDRIINYSQYLLFGAGEGEYYRFNETKELHSVPASIFFSYGIVGLIIFMFAYSKLSYKLGKQVIALSMALGVFVLVHMSLRVPYFWISSLFIMYLHERNISKPLVNNEIAHENEV